MGTQCGHWTVDGGHLTSQRRSRRRRRQPKVESNFAWAANLHASVSSAGHVFHSSSCLGVLRVCASVCACVGVYIFMLKASQVFIIFYDMSAKPKERPKDPRRNPFSVPFFLVVVAFLRWDCGIA